MSDSDTMRSSATESALVASVQAKFDRLGHRAGGLVTPLEAAAMAARIRRLESVVSRLAGRLRAQARAEIVERGGGVS